MKGAGLSNEARSFYWYRGTLVNLVCVALSAAFTGYAYSAGENTREASQLIDGEDRSANLRVIGLLFGVSLVVAFYGLGVQFTLARQGGQPGGGNLAAFGYSYSATSGLLCFTMFICFVLNAWLAMTGFSTIALNTMMKAVSLYGSDESTRKAFDATHKKLQCCGGKNYTDWYFVPWTDDISVSKQISVGIPESCCDRSNASAQHIKCTTTVPRKYLSKMTPYLSGCAETFAYLYRLVLLRDCMMLIVPTLCHGWMAISSFRTLSAVDQKPESVVPDDQQKKATPTPKKHGGPAPPSSRAAPGGETEPEDDEPQSEQTTAATAMYDPYQAYYANYYGGYPGYGYGGYPGYGYGHGYTS